MDIVKKSSLSVIWIVVVVLASYGFRGLRHIGTTWMNNPGFFRMIGLTLFCLLFIALPFVLALLTWFNQPSFFYKKFIQHR